MRLVFLLTRLAAEMRVFIRTNEIHAYEVRPRKDKRGVDLISDVLPFCRLWYSDRTRSPIGQAERLSRSHDAVLSVYDDTGNVIETHEHKGDFKEW